MAASDANTPRKVTKELSCYEVLRHLRWPEGIACPRCRTRSVITHSQSSRSPRRKYLCRGCGRMFTDFTGTPFARTNLPLSTWFLYLRLFDQGLSTSELARELNVKWDTAMMLQRRVAVASSHSYLLKQLREALKQDLGGRLL